MTSSTPKIGTSTIEIRGPKDNFFGKRIPLSLHIIIPTPKEVLSCLVSWTQPLVPDF